jgi:hypothetical protein
MTRTWLIGMIVAVVLAPVVAAAQDGRGAERIEIDGAIFGAGGLIIKSAALSESRSRSYVVSGAVTANVNRWFGVEGDVAWVAGHREAHSLYGVVPPGPRAPNMAMYSGNLVYNPFASNRPLVPYLTVGAGGLTTFEVPAGSTFGLAGDTTYLTASGGGGLRWFPVRHWGVRGDYRMLHIRNGGRATAPGSRVVRSAHRVYGALVLTF